MVGLSQPAFANGLSLLYAQQPIPKPDPAAELGSPTVNPSEQQQLESAGNQLTEAQRIHYESSEMNLSIHPHPGFVDVSNYAGVPWAGDLGYDCDPGLDCTLGPTTSLDVSL